MARTIPAVVATFALLSVALHAAELRTTVGDRTIYRQVSFQDEVIPDTVVDLGGKPPSGVWEDAVFATDVASPCQGCGAPGCNSRCAAPCGRWAQFDYLLWWRRGGSLPPLFTTSPNGTAPNLAGVLGLRTTTVLFGNQTYGDDAAPGGRVTVGRWLDDCECNSIEGRFFALGRETVNFRMNSNGAPILTRPFNNRDNTLGPVGPAARPLAVPGIADNGLAFVHSESDVYGADLVLRRRARDTGSLRFDVMLGYQFSRIDEQLTIQDSLVDRNQNNLIMDGTRQSISDRFDTQNEFHGGLIGLDATYYGPRWRLELLARIAFGSMRQMVNINGQRLNEVPNQPPALLAGGFLAGNANQGQRERTEFAVVPELGVKMAYQLSDFVDLSFGYSFIYWSSVVQAGQQIEPNLFVPSAFVFNDNSYWVHGLNAGIDFRF